MAIKYTVVTTSSNIVGIHYNPKDQNLYIKFKNMREYKYSEVTKEEFEQLTAKDASLGKELNRLIVNKKPTEEIW